MIVQSRATRAACTFRAKKTSRPTIGISCTSVIVGVAAQTADVAITRRGLRRLNTVHALFAFAFNTVIVALTINLLAGLFG